MTYNQLNDHYNKLSKELFEVAKSKGFYDAFPNLNERESNFVFQHQKAALILVEAAEAYEAYRSGFIDASKEDIENLFINRELYASQGTYSERYNKVVKGSVAEELADVVIRTLDLLAALDFNVNLEHETVSIDEDSEINHEFLNYFQRCLNVYKDRGFENIIVHSYRIARMLDIDLDKHITLKTFRNKEREYMHGKKF